MDKNIESTRQLKVAKEIQKVMAEIIRSKGMAAFGGALVSVSGVKVSPDLSVAKVYVSIFPSEKAEAVMAALEENNKALRGELGHMIRMGMGQIPAGNADLFSCGSALPEETVDPVVVVDLEIVTTVNQEETAVAAADDEAHAAVDEGVVYFVLPNGGLRSALTRIR